MATADVTGIVAVVGLAVTYLISGSYNPFLYFRFLGGMPKCAIKSLLLYILRLEKQLYERKEAVQELEHTIRILKFEKVDLEQNLRIANEISQYRVQGQVSN